MRIIGSRRVVGGLVAAVLAVGGVFGVLAASSGATRPVARSAAARPLGSMTALSWGVQTPVRARLVLRPSISFELTQRALRVLRATKPRLSGSFVARLVTAPRRGRSRTVVVVSHRVSDLALGTSAAGSILGRQLQLRQWTLTRKQTQAVKRAAARGSLALALSARYSVSYTNARRRRVTTPTRSASTTLTLALRPQGARGGNLRQLAGTFRGLLGQAGRLKTACVTRNSIIEDLRSAYSAMVSGDRSGAAVLLLTDIRADSEVMRSAGLISSQQASMLGSGLGTLLARVGSGQSKRVQKTPRWQALPNCAPKGARTATATGRRASMDRLAASGRGASVDRLAATGRGASVDRLAHASGSTGEILHALTYGPLPPPPPVPPPLPTLPPRGTGIKAILAPTPTAIPAHPGVLRLVHKLLKKIRNVVIAATGFTLIAGGATAIGFGVRGLIKANAPDDPAEPSATAELAESDPTGATAVLDNLKFLTNSFLNQERDFLAVNPSSVGGSFTNLLYNMERERWRFQPSGDFYSAADQVDLLPAFTDYINTYLAVLREGVVNGYRWGLTPDAALSLEDKIRAELNPNSTPAPCLPNSCPGGNAASWVQVIYDNGLRSKGSSTDPQTDFALTNAYKEYTQVSVFDLRNLWFLQDPMGYPYGDPSFKQDRMIYTDAVGTTTHTFAPPANPAYPLSALTAWSTRVTAGSYSNRNWLMAIQADNSPQVGARTGAPSSGSPLSYDVAPGSYQNHGPVVQVDTTEDQISSKNQKIFGTMQFHTADGTTQTPGYNFYDRGSPYTNSWMYDGEVLAAAKVMGSYVYGSYTLADSVVFGFRFADSFASSWQGSLPGAFRAPSSTACLGVEQVSITSGTHIGTTGSRVDGAALQMRDCNSGEWDQTWRYIDYNDPNDPNDDAAQHELTVYAGTTCATPKPGGTTVGTPVQAYACDGSQAQKWTKYLKTSAIINDQSGLCLERAGGAVTDGTPLRLNTCNGSAAQQWTWP